MVNLVLKVGSDVDFYVYWSTASSAPLAFGRKVAVARALLQLGESAAAQRFDRADATGTSSIDGLFSWMQQGVETADGRIVRHADLPRLCRLVDQGRPYRHLSRPS